MAATEQVKQNTKELIEAPTQVTTHTHNSTDIETKNNYEE